MDELSYTTLLDLTTLDLQSINIRQGLQEMYPRASLKIFGEYDLDTAENIAAYFITEDHLGIDQVLFIGILLSSSWSYDPGNDITSISGCGLGYFESMQYVPETYLHNYASVNPAVTIYGITGGDEWAGSGGIEPYRIMPVTAWGGTLNTRVFDFDRLTSIKNAIQKICDYTRHVHFVQSMIDMFNRPVARRYFVHENDLDTYMDLPAPVTITNPDNYLKAGVDVESKGEEVYNYIVVIGQDPFGGVISAVRASDDAIQGTVPLKVYPERTGAFTTQAQCQARADELYDFYVDPATVYSATFLDRMDFRLLQKIRFSGYASFATDWMRITDIDYTVASQGDGIEKSVKIQFTLDSKFSNVRRMYRSSIPDPVGEIESVFDAKMSQIPGNEIGTVQSLNGDGTATVLLEDGREIIARII